MDQYSRDSRISQLLTQSRSRHHTVESMELKKISREWQLQKKLSKQSNNEVKKMLREMRYFEKLNQRLGKEVSKGNKQLKAVQKVRSRHSEDISKKRELDQLRCNQILKNHQLAFKIKEDREKRASAVQRNIYFKKSSGLESRAQSRRLREQKEQIEFDIFSKNRSRVESIVQFQHHSREKSIMRRENDLLDHIRNHENQIQKEKEAIKMRETESGQVRKRLKMLTEASTRKLNHIQQLNHSISKYSSPYRTPLRFNPQKLHNQRKYSLSKNSMDKTQQESTLFISNQNYLQ